MLVSVPAEQVKDAVHQVNATKLQVIYKRLYMKERVIGLDLVRSFAIFSVIAGHFLVLNTPFRQTVFDGGSMFMQGMIYLLFNATGVPLFIMMTGYLNANKTSCDRKYYKGMVRVIVSYLLFSVITILFRKYYIHEDLSCFNWLRKILDFSAIPYGWYIEMWIGLYILTPFLNLLYKAIPTKKQKQILIVSLFICTALPDLFNRYGFYLVPGFWQKVFPLTFFFIGSYIREYQIDINKVFNKWGGVISLIVIILVCAINPIFNILFVKNHTMVQIVGGSNGVFGTIVAVLTFLLLYRVDYKNKFVRGSLTRISLLSLDMYLCCYIFDRIFYPYFIDRYFVNQAQFGWFFFIIVPLVFVSSLVMAQVKEWVFKGGGKD